MNDKTQDGGGWGTRGVWIAAALFGGASWLWSLPQPPAGLEAATAGLIGWGLGALAGYLKRRARGRCK